MTLKIGIAGLGTVGVGVVKQLEHVPQIQLCAVSARDRTRERGVFLDNIDWEEDPLTLAARKDIDVVVELIGGAEGIAKKLATETLNNKKHLVTANKALLAEHGMFLGLLAERKGVTLSYEAAVAGGVPVIKILREVLAGDPIRAVRGILNGTCNYILTQMEEKQQNFEDALKEAQALGYAEADASFDTGGLDAAHKLSIVTTLAFGVEMSPVPFVGIEAVGLQDVWFARAFESRIKLIASAVRRKKGIAQSVHPALVPLSSPLAEVGGAKNALGIWSEGRGVTFLEGLGAGEGPTAAAVISDVLDIASGHFCRPFGGACGRLQTAPEEDKAFYIRVNLHDTPGSMAQITTIFGELGISLERIMQPSWKEKAGGRPVGLITHKISKAAVVAAKNHLSQSEVIDELLILPVERET